MALATPGSTRTRLDSWGGAGTDHRSCRRPTNPSAPPTRCRKATFPQAPCCKVAFLQPRAGDSYLPSFLMAAIVAVVGALTYAFVVGKAEPRPALPDRISRRAAPPR